MPSFVPKLQNSNLSVFHLTLFLGHYFMSVTMGCLPISTFYICDSTTFLFRFVIFLNWEKMLTNADITMKLPQLITLGII